MRYFTQKKNTFFNRTFLHSNIIYNFFFKYYNRELADDTFKGLNPIESDILWTVLCWFSLVF